jgi:hypothetical protein
MVRLALAEATVPQIATFTGTASRGRGDLRATTSAVTFSLRKQLKLDKKRCRKTAGQHEHDATGPIPRFNIFDARSR